MARVILHIAERAAWQRALDDGAYRGDTLDSEGFIHCSYPHQVVRVADAMFAGRAGLILLVIDAGRLASEVRDEAFEAGGETFPHIYGPLNLEAVTEALPFEPTDGGTFRFPLPTIPEGWYETEDEWFEATRALLEASYLSAKEPYGGSGFRGGPARWEMARRPIVEAIDHDGSFLDVGCANGLLLESLVGWAAERGRRIEPFGLDISERLAELARRRVGHVFVGNVHTWEPTRRFDYVRTELGYVPRARRPHLVARLLDEFLEPTGRLIVCSYGSPRRRHPPEDVAATLREWGYSVDGTAEAHEGEGPVTRVAWLSPTGS
jgi:uncharacterized protein (DUF952 family)/SAM-dependent methyltransferase